MEQARDSEWVWELGEARRTERSATLCACLRVRACAQSRQ